MLCHGAMKDDNHLLVIGLYLSSPSNALSLNYEGRQSPPRLGLYLSSPSNALSLKYEARQSPPRHRPQVPFKPLECSVTELWSKTITSSPSASTFQAPLMLCHWTRKQKMHLLVIDLYLSSPSNALSLNYEGRQSPSRHRPLPFKPL